MYIPSLILTSLVLSKIWPGQASITQKWLWGDNSINIQGRFVVLVPFPSLPSIYKPSFISIP